MDGRVAGAVVGVSDWGIFLGTSNMGERRQQETLSFENAERIARQQQRDITIIIGNPPYNVGQINENDNNKNRVYPVIDQRVRETYTRDSTATNRNVLSDVYVKFFRWATDRLADRDGLICFVTNNGFLDGIAFDGFRKHLAQDFTHIYHLDLGGNTRTGGRGNVFHIRVGVGITILVRKRGDVVAPRRIFYHAIDDTLSGDAKLVVLEKLSESTHVPWKPLQPDERQTWLTEGLRAEFDTFMPMGSKESKGGQGDRPTIFMMYSCGVSTSRDSWVYHYRRETLIANIQRFITIYNSEVDRWKREKNENTTIDDFVLYDDTQIKWSRDLKLDIQRGKYAAFEDRKIQISLYRPFCKQYLFYDRILNEEIRSFPRIFPTPEAEAENVVLCVSGIAHRSPFAALATNVIPNLTINTIDSFQCFPFYTYNPDGTNRTENITDWALAQFQARCGKHVTKWDIFYYIYAILHHPFYRERYAKNLRRDLPHIPLPTGAEAFATLAGHGKTLADLHVHYEQAPMYRLEETRSIGKESTTWRVEKMQFNKDRTQIIVNPGLTLAGIPPECFAYRLGNRSALEWVIDQYQVKTDKRSGIVNDPNREDDHDYIVNLVKRVVTVSVETVRIVGKIGRVEVGVEE